MTEKESLKDLLNQEAATETVAPSRDMETRELLEEEAAAAALDTDNLDELIKAAAAFGWPKRRGILWALICMKYHLWLITF